MTAAIIAPTRAPAPTTTRTLTRSAPESNRYTGHCPTCGAHIVVTSSGDEVQIGSGCKHLRRGWRVTKDKRVRVEFTVAAGEG